MYIYQRSNWPNFTWDDSQLIQALAQVKYEQGQLLGKMNNLGFDIKEQATLQTLTADIVKSSEIEGETLNQEEVRSSVARHLGMDVAGLLPSDRHIDGFVEVLLDATQHYQKPLTEKRILTWHALLFPGSISRLQLINPGMLRRDSEGPMQVVSGSYGREKIHFQAPPAKQLAQDIKQFIAWFNGKCDSDPLIRAAIAHLWFVTLHPFDDGNGRISRAIGDMALAQAEQSQYRFYSLSTHIRKSRKSYYDILEKTQKGPLNITPWLLWFLDCLQSAIRQSDALLKNTLNKAAFWKKHATTLLNERQVTMLNKLFDDFFGHLTTSKWAKINKCSQDTASRDIQQLVKLDILEKSNAGGRNTHYLLKK